MNPTSSSNPSLVPVIRPIHTRTELDDFVRLPGQLQQHDAQWIEPLHIERKLHLSSRNPVFEHVTWQGWIAWAGKQPVGRISAQVDSLEQPGPAGEVTGHFGLLEAVDDPAVFAALMTTAEAWLRQKGVQRATGPFSLTINEESGLLVEGFDRPPSMMMGHAPPYYGPRLEAQGYQPAKDLLAYWIRVPEFRFNPAMQQMMDRVRGQVKIRQLDRSHFDEELMSLRDIFNDAWSKNWGFVPFTESEFRDLGNNLKLLVPPDMTLIAEVDGRAAAFIVCMPNLNEAIAPLNGHLLPLGWLRLLWRLKVRPPRTARVPLMGVRKEFQFSRLGPALALLLIEAEWHRCQQRGIEGVELSWILENNAGMRSILEGIGSDIYKRYRIYEKSL
jgi:hypothetical protein